MQKDLKQKPRSKKRYSKNTRIKESTRDLIIMTAEERMDITIAVEENIVVRDIIADTESQAKARKKSISISLWKEELMAKEAKRLETTSKITETRKVILQRRQRKMLSTFLMKPYLTWH